MKITDPDVIKNGEKDLIEALKKDLDLTAVKTIIQKKIETAAISSQGGEIVVHNNKIAFRLDFDLRLSSSLLFDRQGNYISESDGADDPENLIADDLNLEDIDMDPMPEEKNDTGLDLLIEDVKPQTSFEEIDDMSMDDIIEDDAADSDISDILKESREFWEKKKDS